MKKQILLLVSLIFISANFTLAQNRTITNADLGKFRDKRLAAERDYRENYERLGFPSPEELQKQIEQSRVERAQLAQRLRAENLERDRIALEAQIAENESRNNRLQIQLDNYGTGDRDYSSGYAANGFYNFQNYGFQSYGYPNYRLNRFSRGGYRNGYRGNYNNQPYIEYRNNLPVIVRPAQPIFAPPVGNGRRN